MSEVAIVRDLLALFERRGHGQAGSMMADDVLAAVVAAKAEGVREASARAATAALGQFSKVYSDAVLATRESIEQRVNELPCTGSYASGEPEAYVTLAAVTAAIRGDS